MGDKKELQFPCIHMNGSGAKDLQKGIYEAYSAIQAAKEKLCAMSPHGRDYYPLGDEAYSKARKEHTARLQALENVCEELIAIHQHIDK